jgi:hypothetical protein
MGSSLEGAAEVAMDLWATPLKLVILLRVLESIIGLFLVRKRSVFLWKFTKRYYNFSGATGI